MSINLTTSTQVTVNGTTYTYMDRTEAKRQFLRWTAQAIYFGRGKGGDYDVTIQHEDCHLHVMGYDNSSLSVREHSHLRKCYWTRAEIKDFSTKYFNA